MATREQNVPRLIVPAANARETAVVSEVAVFGVGTLTVAASGGHNVLMM
jgi:predicted ATPase with chaperone activity